MQAIDQLKRAIPLSYRRFLWQTYQRSSQAARNARRLMLQQRMALVIGSANRVGSTWLFQLLTDLGHFDQGYDRLPTHYQDAGCVVLEDDAVFDHLRRQPGFQIYKTHSYPPSVQRRAGIRFVTIYRDLRDVVTSNIFSLKHLRKFEIAWAGGKFRELPERERVIVFLQEADYAIAKLEQWYHDPLSYQVRYEDLQQHPLEILRGAARFLGLPSDTWSLSWTIRRNSFEKRSGRTRGEERADSAMRKGIVNDWRNYFDAECIEVFKTAMDGRWNRLLVEMGYESSLDWS